jgi:hypothetical protein
MTKEAFQKKSDGWYSFKDNRKIDFPTITPPPSGIFGDPGIGHVYYGIDIGANDQTNGYLTRESQMGHRMGCLRSYFNNSSSSTSSAVSRATADIAAGRVPMMSFKLNGGPTWSWAQFAAGSGDSWFMGLLNSLNAIGAGPILICLHHEPNGDGTASDYLAMCRHAMALKGSSYPRIQLVGGWLADSYYYTNQRNPALVISEWIQPDSCDLPGLDFYHADDGPGGTWRNFATSFASTQTQLASIYGGLDNMPPLSIGEWGVHTWLADTTKTTAYMTDFYNWMLQYGHSMAYFDAVGTLWTTLDQQGKVNAAADWDGETGPPWIRYDKFVNQLGLSTSSFIPLGGLT